ARLDGIENVAPGQVDRRRRLPGDVDIGLVGGDHRVDDALHVAAGENVRFHLRRRDVDPRAAGLNARVDDGDGVDLSQLHADQVEHAHARAADEGADVKVNELKEQSEDHQQHDQ